MTYFLENNNKYNIVSKDALNVTEHLPYGVYTLQTDPFGAFFLEKGSEFVLPEKCYGENPIVAKRIFNTFLNRESSTGVLLSGEKGSGKTLLTKTLSIMGKEYDMPTITIGAQYAGAKFSLLIQSIEQPCIILFDEFEKVYSERPEQEGLLSLLDGVFNSKKLFIFTANDIWSLSKYMFNRPGRIFYHIRYKSLSEAFIKEYCDDKLRDLSKVEEIINLTKTIRSFNFDMLQCLVEELNRYNESVNKAVYYLNIDLDNENEAFNVIEFRHSDETVELEETREDYQIEFNISNPKSKFDIYFSEKCEEDIENVENEDKSVLEVKSNKSNNSNRSKSLQRILDRSYTSFRSNDIVKVEKNGSLFTLQNSDGFIVVIEKQVKSENKYYRDFLY